jgi:ribosomal-protein-alanine N-acetyltransferase
MPTPTSGRGSSAGSASNGSVRSVGSGTVLETARLSLRELTTGDFEAVHAYASDPEVVRYMTWGPNTRQDTLDFLESARAAAREDPRHDYELGVVTRDGARLVGCVGLHVRADETTGMLGYCFHREAWGLGYATEAGRAMLALGFDVLLLHRIWAGCDPDNIRSARVLEKLGMRLEGRLRDDVRVRGDYRDSLVYGVLESEWTGPTGADARSRFR